MFRRGPLNRTRLRNWSDRQRSHGRERRDRDVRNDNTESKTVIGMVHSVIMRWLESLGKRSDQRDRYVRVFRRRFSAAVCGFLERKRIPWRLEPVG